jgi:hypothetical protein
MKKIRIILILLGLGFFSGFSASAEVLKTLELDSVTHTLEADGVVQSGVAFSLTDRFSPVGRPVSEVSLSIHFNEAKLLKSLVLRFDAAPSFVPSGEVSFIFSESKRITLYCLPVVRASKAGKTSYQLTFLSNLSPLCQTDMVPTGEKVGLAVFTKKNSFETLSLPKAFFELMRAAAH